MTRSKRPLTESSKGYSRVTLRQWRFYNFPRISGVGVVPENNLSIHGMPEMPSSGLVLVFDVIEDVSQQLSHGFHDLLVLLGELIPNLTTSSQTLLRTRLECH